MINSNLFNFLCVKKRLDEVKTFVRFLLKASALLPELWQFLCPVFGPYKWNICLFASYNHSVVYCWYLAVETAALGTGQCFWAQALSKPCEPHSLDQDDHRRLFKTRTSNCFVMGCCYNHQLTPNCVFPLNFWIISQCPFEMRSISQHSLFTIWK